MRKTIEHSLYAITPIIDYKDFYLSYHRRKNPIIIKKENELPKIKKIPLRTEISTQEFKNDKEINNLIKRNLKFNSIHRSVDPNRTNSINYSLYTPFIKTEQICYPKINPINPPVKNYISQYKSKVQKKNGKLSIQNLDLISLDTKTNLLVYEIIKKDKILENEIANTVNDPSTKNKIINEIRNIDKNTNQELNDILRNTSKEMQMNSFKNFDIQPKIINLGAEEIMEEFNNKNSGRTNIEIKKEDNLKKKIKLKNSDKKEEKLNDIFFDFAKKNIKRKIELRNQYNQELSIEYVEALIRNELEKIKFILALYCYNSNPNDIGNFSINKEEGNSLLVKDLKNKNYLDKSFNKFFKLNKFYNSLLSHEKRTRNKKLYENNKYLFNTLDKNKINYNRYNTDNDYINILMNHISNSSDEEENQNENNEISENNFYKRRKDNNLKIINSAKDKSLFLLYNRDKMMAYARLRKLNQKDLNNNLLMNKKNLMHIKPKLSLNINDKKKENIKSKEIIQLNKGNSNISFQKIKGNNKFNEISTERGIKENDKNKSTNSNKIIDLVGENKNNNNNNDDIILNLKEELNFKKNEKEEIKNETNIEGKKEKKKKKHKIKKDQENEDTDIIEKNNEKQGEIDEEQEKNNDEQVKKNKNTEKIKENIENNNEEVDEGEEEENELKENSENDNEEINETEDLNENNEDETEEEEKGTSNNSQNKEMNQFYDNLNEEVIDTLNIGKDEYGNIINEKEIEENINLNKRKKKGKGEKNITKKSNKSKQHQKKIKNKENLLNSQTPDKDINLQKEIIESIFNKKNILVKKKNKNNHRKNKRNLKLNTIRNDKNKRVSSSHKDRNLLISSIKTSNNIIKNFEIIKKKKKRNRTDGNIHLNDNEDEVNIIKLQDTDIDKILKFVNEEEKRRLKNDKSAKIIEKEKIIKKTEDNIHSLFKEKKEENINDDNLTRDDFVEKLKKDDLKMRQYIEGIIRSGLTIGNKKLNKQMKNNSILVYKDYNLGLFKFNRNFGIKDEINYEPFRPLSGKEKKVGEEEEKEKEEKRKKKKKEKEKEKEKKKEKPKKQLIYDNKYLFTRRKSIKYILRKEVEEILNGGILLQQKEKKVEENDKEETKKIRFDIPKKKTFVKKKQNRQNLLTKSVYLRDFLDEEKFKKLGEDDELTKQLKLQEKIKDENLENKLNEFINRINNFKKDDDMNFLNNNKLDNYIDLRLNLDDDEKEKKEKENRINEFVTSLNDYRIIKKQQRKINDTFHFKKPVLIDNLMIDNFEENNSSLQIGNNSENKSQILLKDLGKIKTQYSNKRYEKKNNNSYCEEKNFLTEIYY